MKFVPPVTPPLHEQLFGIMARRDAEMAYQAGDPNRRIPDPEFYKNAFYMSPSGARDPYIMPRGMYNHVPLTPPHSEPMVSPQHQRPSPSPPSASPKTTKPSVIEPPSTASVTVKQEPGYSQSSEDSNKSMDYWSSPNTNGHLQNLEQTMEDTVLAARRRNSGSPGSSGSSGDDRDARDARKRSNEDTRVPKLKSNGKLRVYKCRHCDFKANTKDESWMHARLHIPPEKRLDCNQCLFCTEYKHHLEYHLRNHSGKKPYKCDQCDYRCVNKSMLSSHLKCHSDVHQYHCGNCNYISKYCHSLKIHLRKYKHIQGKVLNPDGTENPDIVVDVYGNRRGPKRKTQQQQRSLPQQQPQNPQEPLPSTSQAQLPFPLQAQFMLSQPPLVPGLPFVNPAALSNPLFLQDIQRLVQETQQLQHLQQLQQLQHLQQLQQQLEEQASSPADEPAVLDLSKPGPSTGKNRRKGRAYRMYDIPAESSEEEGTTTMFSNVEVVQNEEANPEDPNNNLEGQDGQSETVGAENDSNNNKASGFVCEPCGITFADHVLHTIHMGLHGYSDPFTCNVCGLQCNGKVEFSLHVLRPRHLHGESA